MNYRAFFNDIVTETTGTYKMYGLTRQESDELMRLHKGKVSGSKGNYTVYDNAVTATYLKVYIPSISKLARIDVRNEILELTNMKKISPKFIKTFKLNMPKNIDIYYDKIDKKWHLADENLLEKVIRESGY